MSFWNIFRKKDKETAASDTSAVFTPTTFGSGSSSDTPTPGGNDAGHATSTDSGASSFGGDGGGASGGDGGGI